MSADTQLVDVPATPAGPRHTSELLKLARLFEGMLADLCDYDNSGGVLCAEAGTDAMLARVRAAIRQAEGGRGMNRRANAEGKRA